MTHHCGLAAVVIPLWRATINGGKGGQWGGLGGIGGGLLVPKEALKWMKEGSTMPAVGTAKFTVWEGLI